MYDDVAMQRAVDWIHDADGLLITAGAGMGVDSGLPDFRGTEGFWRAYPALRHHGFSFEDIANPAVFVSNPRLGWGFYGHRLALYRSTVPHAGFGILLKWAARMNRGGFVFTSNVDGQFIRAGFRAANVAECHGTIHQLQCVEACTDEAWSAGNFNPIVNETTCLLENDLPRCPHCGALARPNILMFGDWKWVARYTEQQERALAAWLASVGRLVVVELGAGRALPTVRRFSERSGERVIRVNPRDHEISPTIGVGIAVSALDALQRLDDLISSEADQFRWRLAP